VRSGTDKYRGVMYLLGQARPKVHVSPLRRKGRHTFQPLDKLGPFQMCVDALIIPMVAVLRPVPPDLLVLLEGLAPPVVEESPPVFCCFCLF
jgi:hypothetical protein